MENGKEAAFATASVVTLDGLQEQGSFGLTKREYFAAIAMNGLAPIWSVTDSDLKECARRSISLADELLKQLDQ